MLKLLGWLIKSAVFALVILVLGHYVRVGGHTVSDQVSTGLAQAERSKMATEVRQLGNEWIPGLTAASAPRARTGARSRGPAASVSPARASAPAPARAESETENGATEAKSPEEISSSERQKLKALIRELNRSSNSARRQ